MTHPRHPSILSIVCFVVTMSAGATKADTLNAALRVYGLEAKGNEEPVWTTSGEARKWSSKSKGFNETYQAPEFPDIEQTFEYGDKFRFVATKTPRGRIVISLYSDDELLAHSQDNLLGDSCALSYTHTTGGGVLRFDILVWTHP